MERIWKFGLLLIDGVQTIEAPISFRVVHAAMQGPQLFVWAVVDPMTTMSTHQFHVYGTGQDIDRGRKYVMSVMDHEFVWHVFEVLQ